MNKIVWVWLALLGAIGVVSFLLLFSQSGDSGLIEPENRPNPQQSQRVIPASKSDQVEIKSPVVNPVPASGKQTYHLNVDGADREFIVYRPEKLAGNEKTPVVFMFHGGNEFAENQYQNSGWRQKADEQGILVVFPQSLKYHVFPQDESQEHAESEGKYETRWNNYSFDITLDLAYPDQKIYDDLAFVRAIATFIEQQYPVDATRFYATGFSNGGSFTSRLMVEASDLFAAFAPSSSGGVPLKVLLTVDDYKSDNFTIRPAIQMVGSSDPKLARAFGIKEFSTDESAVDANNPVRIKFIDPYLNINELSDDYTYESGRSSSRFIFGVSLSGVVSEAPYQLMIINGMGHIYPNGNNHRLVATDYYWEFFKGYSL